MEPGNRGTRVMPCVPAHDSEDFDRNSSLSRQLTLNVPRVDLTERPGCLPRLADASVSDRRAAVGLAPKPRTSLAKDPAPASNSFPNSLSTATWLTSFNDRVYHGVYRVAVSYSSLETAYYDCARCSALSLSKLECKEQILLYIPCADSCSGVGCSFTNQSDFFVGRTIHCAGAWCF